MLGGQSKVEVPFKFVAGYMVIDVKISDFLVLPFIFDTGAEHTIILEKTITDLLAFSYDKEIQLRGSDLSTTIDAFISRNVPMQLEDTNRVLRDILVLENNDLNLKELIGVNINGIVGGRYFKNLIVEIDHRKSKLIFYHPKKFKQPPKSYKVFDLILHNHKPYITAQAETIQRDSIDLTLLLDTGAALTYLLNSNNKLKIKIPESATPGSLGNGLGGQVEGYLGKMRSLEFADFKFYNILTNYQSIDDNFTDQEIIFRDGIIGNMILSRFNLIIDYFNQKIYFKPLRKIKQPFKYNLSGMQIIAFGPELRNFMIHNVLPDSPAALAGIESGDIINKINFFKAQRWTLAQIERTLSSKDGRKIRLLIQRKEEEILKEITLEDYLK